MLLNLSDVLTSEGMEIREEIPLEMTCYENGKLSHRFQVAGAPDGQE